MPNKNESLSRELEIIRESFNDQFNPGDSYENWVMEIFDDYVIASFDVDYFQIPYSTVNDEIIFSSRADWKEVEREWIAKKNYLKILRKTKDELIVGNYLILFGGKDLQGETFPASLSLDEFESDYTKMDRVLTDWEHGYDWNKGAPGRDDLLGRVLWETAKVDGIGLWAQQALDRRKEYMADLEILIEEGLIGGSTEATNKARVEKGMITRWPVKRNALTVTPAEPRMLTDNVVQSVKALSGKIPSLKAWIPKAGVTGADPAGGRVAPDSVNSTIPNIRGKNMPKLNEEFDLEAIKAQAKADALAEITAAQEAEEARKAEVADVVAAAIEEFSKTLPPVNENFAGYPGGMSALQFDKSDMGDTPEAAFIKYVKTGDVGALAAIQALGGQLSETQREAMKASNATDMNITTDADGGYTVPTGHFQGIISKLDEIDITQKLGCRNIPGKGTTVNVPYDNEDDGEWILTSESGTSDVDSPALGQHTMTLGAYTKNVPLTRQLLRDEDSKLMAYLNDFIARGLAKTKNNLMITAAGSGGTSLKTFASATVIAFGEIEDIIGNDALDAYLDDSGSVSWVMRNSVLWEIYQLKGDQRQYYYKADNGELLGHPVQKTAKSGATSAAAKSVYFGNWYYMGFRDGDGIGFLRDPYSNASKGWVNLWYVYDTVYQVLQSEAIGYGIQATA